MPVSTLTTPTTPDSPRPDRWRPLATVGLGVMAMTTYVGIVAVGLQRSHDREVELARRGQESLAKVLEQHALATVNKIDTVLSASRLHVGPALYGASMDRAETNATLARYLALIGEPLPLIALELSFWALIALAGAIASAFVMEREGAG